MVSHKGKSDRLGMLLGDRHGCYYVIGMNVIERSPCVGIRRDQSWDVPYLEFKPIDDQLIVGAGYMKDTKTLRISLYGEYHRTCKANDFAIVDIKADGSRDQTCD